MIGIVYKLTDKSHKVYYGSTKQTLKERLKGHRSCYNNCRSRYMDKDTMNIECLEKYYYDVDVDYKSSLKKREAYYIRNFECINKIIPNRSEEQSKNDYRINNKELIITRGKQYYIENKDKILLKTRQTYEKNKEIVNQKFNCECGGKYIYRTKSRHNKSKKHQSFLA